MANLTARIAEVINANLSGGSTVAVTLVPGSAGPAGQDNETTEYLRIASNNGDVRIEPAPANDLAVPLMLGTAQGGIEVSKFAVKRPAPNGIVYTLANLTAFAALAQTAFDRITIDRVDVGRVTLPVLCPNCGAQRGTNRTNQPGEAG